ncbi:MAG: NCS2 family permease [Gemmatimonadota bacterium]
MRRDPFDLAGQGTAVRTELLAGLTTFLTMAYITVVNPAILSAAFGTDPETMHALVTATCLSAAVATLVMGLWANYPVGLAPGMGSNAFFVSVCTGGVIGATVGWQTALGAVFWSGVLFLALSAFRLRETIINSLPASLKCGIAAGIGLFLAYIGLRNGGLVAGAPPESGLLTVRGDYGSRDVWVMAFGLLATGVLLARRVPAAILIGIVGATGFHHLLNGGLPDGLRVVAAPSFSLFGKLDLGGVWRRELIQVLLVFLYMDLFDTVGTLVAVAKEGDLLDERGHLPRAGRAFVSDAAGTMVGALFGTSTVTSYIESGAGIAAGGRTGLTAIVVAALFLAAIPFAPLAALVPAAATAPALVIVGIMMMRQVGELDWKDWAQLLPAFIVILAIPFTNGIHTGIAYGFISYAAVMTLAGRWREVSLLTYVLAVVLLLLILA